MPWTKHSARYRAVAMAPPPESISRPPTEQRRFVESLEDQHLFGSVVAPSSSLSFVCLESLPERIELAGAPDSIIQIDGMHQITHLLPQALATSPESSLASGGLEIDEHQSTRCKASEKKQKKYVRRDFDAAHRASARPSDARPLKHLSDSPPSSDCEFGNHLAARSGRMSVAKRYCGQRSTRRARHFRDTGGD